MYLIKENQMQPQSGFNRNHFLSRLSIVLDHSCVHGLINLTGKGWRTKGGGKNIPSFVLIVISPEGHFSILVYTGCELYCTNYFFMYLLHPKLAWKRLLLVVRPPIIALVLSVIILLLVISHTLVANLRVFFGLLN